MLQPGYTPEFRAARRNLRRGLCPNLELLEHIYQQNWEDHLGESEKVVARECLREYGVADQWL
ncbi:MAG: hypothetical protein KME27_10775 [Lyngbya sp. HA4199-MV5]|nr:hypothetical protein [Lyngbya sp. HA4199-MV5]